MRFSFVDALIILRFMLLEVYTLTAKLWCNCSTIHDFAIVEDGHAAELVNDYE